MNAQRETTPAWTDDALSRPHSAPDKRDRVQHMFNEIAPRYELVNTVFSGGRDAAWRRKAVSLAQVTAADDCLDVACGTGDLARAFASADPRSVCGLDFAHEMLARALGRGDRRIDWCEGDALALPFAGECFSICSCAFGVRNFADLDAGLREMHRVLRPGGRVVILEFTRPSNPVFRRLYEFYANVIMPRAATIVSADSSGAYRYLPRSVVSFLTASQMCEALRSAGFEDVRAKSLTLGVVTIYVGHRR